MVVLSGGATAVTESKTTTSTRRLNRPQPALLVGFSFPVQSSPDCIVHGDFLSGRPFATMNKFSLPPSVGRVNSRAAGSCPLCGRACTLRPSPHRPACPPQHGRGPRAMPTCTPSRRNPSLTRSRNDLALQWLDFGFDLYRRPSGDSRVRSKGADGDTQSTRARFDRHGVIRSGAAVTAKR
jgi:hypothetical protein